MTRCIIFSGHMIDTAERPVPRFPESLENAVSKRIKKKLEQELEGSAYPLLGISSASAGGDIIFQEICRELAIPTTIYLALSPDEFARRSVSYAGASWLSRYNKLLESGPYHIMQSLSRNTNDWKLFEKANIWMLEEAVAYAGHQVQLLALWDFVEVAKRGGTQHMIDIAIKIGVNPIILNIREILKD